MSAVVYRHFAADGTLLYVGSSLAFFARTMSHIYGAKWSKQIARVDISHFDSRADALLAEEEAIGIENPKYNRRCLYVERTTGNKVNGNLLERVQDKLSKRKGSELEYIRAATGISYDTLLRIRDGKPIDPAFGKVQKLAEYLGVIR